MRLIVKSLFYMLLAYTAIVALTCCGNKNEGVKSETGAGVPIVRIDTLLAEYPSMDPAARDSFLSVYSDALRFLFDIQHKPVSDSVLVDYAGSRAVRIFVPDIVRLLPSLDSVQTILGDVKNNIKSYSRLSMPRLYGIVSPYNQRVFATDSVMLIGLNHYLGADYAGYGSFPQYLRDLKRVDRMPYDIVESLIAGAYPMTTDIDGGMTTLSRFLYQGAVMAAIADIIPEATDAAVLGYNDRQFSWATEHEADLWRALIGGQYLYEVSPVVAERMIAESPSVPFLLPDTPGRIGRFVGLRIVRSYLENNPGTDMEFLLSPEFYGDMSTLVRSGYAPR